MFNVNVARSNRPLNYNLSSVSMTCSIFLP